jgi:hypothetical protein
MAFVREVRIWKFKSSRVRCRGCGQMIQLVIDNRGKYLPFSLKAAPVGEDKTDRGIFQIYDALTCFHRCPAKESPSAPQRELRF